MKWITALLLGCIMMTGMPVSASVGMGYGQGKQVDAENRPTGALEFNAQFGKYDAYATAMDENRIILTFDQGYENGYTDDILDVLAEKKVTAIFFLTGDYAKKETSLVERMI